MTEPLLYLHIFQMLHNLNCIIDPIAQVRMNLVHVHAFHFQQVLSIL